MKYNKKDTFESLTLVVSADIPNSVGPDSAYSCSDIVKGVKE